ncbi:MAG: 2-oxoacid:acceptor oxidoreductase family protein [Deltaproteobacteria bacterium]|nr:2-oxoacid:acceptor oxidoreductase family protein [Deltaproteobacteria bacterium]
MRKEFLFAGSGGQGVITASIIFAEAAALKAGYHVVQSQSYGPEARGGSSSASVVLNTIEVGYPKVIQPQVMICLTQEAFDKFSSGIRPGGLLLSDPFYVRRLGRLDARVRLLPMYEAVRDRVGLPITFNVCVLGALVGLVDVVRPEHVKAVISDRVPARFLDPNLQAFEIGLELAAGAKPIPRLRSGPPPSPPDPVGASCDQGCVPPARLDESTGSR